MNLMGLTSKKQSAEASEFITEGEFLPKKKVKSTKKKWFKKDSSSGSTLNQASSQMLAITN